MASSSDASARRSKFISLKTSKRTFKGVGRKTFKRGEREAITIFFEC